MRYDPSAGPPRFTRARHYKIRRSISPKQAHPHCPCARASEQALTDNSHDIPNTLTSDPVQPLASPRNLFEKCFT